MSIEKTQARDAGHAPSAPTIGPLLNVSHIPAIVQPEEGEQLPAAGDASSDVGSPPQTLFVSGQETSSTPTMEDTPVFDAGPARIDLMTR
jgi:hypothetical protein